MNLEQRAEFERRIIQRAFEAGIEGCDLDTALYDIVAGMRLDDSYEWHLANIEPILAERGKPGGPLRSMKDADWLALSAEEWGVRLQARAIELLRIALSGGTEDLPLAAEFASMLRGKVAT